MKKVYKSVCKNLPKKNNPKLKGKIMHFTLNIYLFIIGRETKNLLKGDLFKMRFSERLQEMNVSMENSC